MKDPRWEEIQRELRRILRVDDTVLLPHGDWPELSCQAVFYDDIIELGDATVFVLHKGRFGSIDKAVLRTISDTWQCIFGNDVFLCFSKDLRARGDLRHGKNRIHYGVLRRFLRSKRWRRSGERLWYIHLPKAAGTWMWNALSRSYPSRIYYPSFVPFLTYPPDVEEYDLIGGHLPLSVITKYLAETDRVVGLMRQPTERLLSAFLHSRRAVEDPSTFTATMRAMRDLPFHQFLQTDSGKLEAQQQLIMLGGGGDIQTSSDQRDCLDRAQQFLLSEQAIFAPCTRSAELFKVMVKRHRIRQKYAKARNDNDYTSQSHDIAEFYNSLDLLQSLNATEHRLYEFVSKRFESTLMSRVAD
jgi:hypothetical protein